MGQKSNPYGLRLGYIRDWKGKWFAKKDYGAILHEDIRIRKFLKTRLRSAGVADVTIERSIGRIRIFIHTARPGIIIGRSGQEINRLRDEVSKLTTCDLHRDDIKIIEVKVPQVDAQLVAENVALQLEKRVAFRKAMKKAVSSAMARGAGGIKIRSKGRLGGSEIARTEGYKEGKVPLGTFRADVTYGFAEAFTTYGTIGVKVWIYHGDVLVKQKEAERAKALEEQKMAQRRHQTVPSKKLDEEKSEAQKQKEVGVMPEKPAEDSGVPSTDDQKSIPSDMGGGS